MDEWTAFLTARLDEAGAEALKSPDEYWRALALRTVEAMRAILAEHAADDHWCARPPNPDWVVYEAGERVVKTYPCGTVRDLAAIWSDRPDYPGR